MIGQTSKRFTLKDAYGLNAALRANLPDFNFPLSQETSEDVVAGMRYCPFMFIKEGKEKHQIKDWFSIR